MKLIFIPLLILFTSFISPLTTECDIDEVYKAVEPQAGVVALIDDELEEVEYYLVPIKINDGDYSVYLTRKAKNLYKVDGKNIYIRTKYCYEYSYGQGAILSVSGGIYRTSGKVIFK